MKKTNLTLKDGLGLLIERADYKGKLRHIELNNNQTDNDCCQPKDMEFLLLNIIMR